MNEVAKKNLEKVQDKWLEKETGEEFPASEVLRNLDVGSQMEYVNKEGLNVIEEVTERKKVGGILRISTKVKEV